ncbi:MAG: DoxX family membrane protein [Bacteroidetes bacterium]|jgi:uncharacterized membrane protein YphA (DoxX/SURF4 family)|nr:DoxX family membrane protein [Bacteroidota bacterium]MCA6442602.1 DoxX family membrane protein [Bacteroidota bacterium]
MKKFLGSRFFRLIWSLGVGTLLYFICPPCFSKTILISILVVLLLTVNFAEAVAKLVWLTHVSRLLVGGLFIFSGFIKANDPIGFSYKLEEYFEVFKEAVKGGAFEFSSGLFDGMAHMALPLSTILCASEIVLGVMLLIGFKPRLTLWLLFAQIAFFTFLTFYSACFNKVTTCGCFGDFLVLKPWTSFWKDVVLMILITILIVGKDNINELVNPLLTFSLFVVGLVFSFAFPVYTIRNLPVFDFRAYKIGNNIKEQMKLPDSYQPPVIETGFIYENIKTGKKEQFTLKNYPWADTLNWKWVATENIVIKEAVNAPKITDFTVTDLNGNAITDSLLNDQQYAFWLIAYDLSKTDDDASLMAEINDFYKLATQNKTKVIGLTASGPKQIDEFKHKHNLLVDFAIVDGTVLKTMIRSNPGLMLVKNGTVVMNWHHNNFPGFSDAKQRYFK